MTRKAPSHLAVLIVLATLLPSHVSPIPFARAQAPRYTVTMIPRLTNPPGVSWSPTFSPDGQKIVFNTKHNGDSHL